MADFNPDGRPKCLLEFGGRSLLARQLDILFKLGIRHATLVIGYEADLVIEHVAQVGEYLLNNCRIFTKSKRL